MAKLLQRCLPGAHRYRLGIALFRFYSSLGIPLRAMGKTPKELGTRVARNHDLLVKHEMLPTVNYIPDVATIKANGVRVFMAAGKMTLDKQRYYGRTAPILAELLGCELVTFPGHRISYLDMPEEWAATLRGVLHRV